MTPPHYDFNDPVFKTKRNWLLYAKEHMELHDLRQNSDVIDYEIKSTVSALKIPSVYHIIYKLNSIVGIDKEAQPIYGDRHVMELTIPTRYPLVPASIFMQTPTWHPNIQTEGRFKGKICGNVDSYGVDYSLRQLVLRVGEILQFKNYLADFVPPYPEDPKVAEWVKAYGEPRKFIHRQEGIVTDEQPLVRAPARAEGGPIKVGSVTEDAMDPAAPTSTAPATAPEKDADKETPKIRIGKKIGGGEHTRKTIRIGRKPTEKDKE